MAALAATGSRRRRALLAFIAALTIFGGCDRSKSNNPWLAGGNGTSRGPNDELPDNELHDRDPRQDACVPDGSTWAVELARLDPEINEASGVVQSRVDHDSLWLHNDSGDSAVLYRVGRSSGDIVQRVTLAGVEARDWEDIAAGDCPSSIASGACLLVGDIGDNNAVRESIAIHLLAEPEHVGHSAEAPMTEVADVQSRMFVYDDGPRDAEALLWWDEQLHVLTKGSHGFDLYSAAWPSEQEASPATLMRQGRIDFVDLFPHVPGAGYVTAADISVDGRHVVVRTYGNIFVLGGLDLDEAGMLATLSTPVASLPPGAEFQGEAIAFVRDGIVHLAEGESVPIWRIPCD